MIPTDNIRYSYTEYNSKQEIVLSIKLIYDVLSSSNKRLIISNNHSILSESHLSPNTIFAFQEQFKYLKSETGKPKLSLTKDSLSKSITTTEQLRPFFLELLSDIKNSY